MGADNLIKKLDDKLSFVDKNGVVFKENHEIEHIQKKLSRLEAELSIPKRIIEKNADLEERAPKFKSFKCDQCQESFGKNCDLEKHFDVNKKAKEHKCNICGNDFYLKLRLEKQEEIHTGNVKHCHFFNNGKICPFAEIG